MEQHEDPPAELDPDAVRIGRMLRDLRNTRRWTLARLGEAIGRTHGYLSKIERGHQKAPIPLLEEIAAAYGIPSTEIVKRAYPDSDGVQLAYADAGH